MLCALAAQQAPIELSPARTPSPVDLEEQERQRQVEAKWNIRTDVMMVAIPQDQAIPIIAEFQSENEQKVEAAFAGILELIQKKRATLLGWPSLVTLDGQRAVTEAIVEKRYPTDFDTPANPSLTPPVDSKLVDQNLNASIPAAFETRNAGVTLEVEARVLDNGARLLVTLVPQRVALTGWNTYNLGKKDVGTSDLAQPEFATAKVTTALSMRNGARVLIAVHRMESPADHIEFFILHSRATPVK